MALNVGELVAYLKMDDSDFQSKSSRATSSWKSLTSTLASGATVVSQGLGVAAASATGLVMAMTKTGASYNSLQQNTRAALTTIMGSAKGANDQMDKLDEFARNSPFSKSVFITAQQQLLGFGVQASKVIPIMDALQNAVAATGGSSQDIGDLAYVLAQVSAAGKVTGEDLMQLGQRGVDAADLVGAQMGKTGAEVKKMISDGKIDANTFIDALTTGMSQKFSGAAANVKQQWSGVEDRLKAAWRDIGAIIATPFIDPHGGGALVTWGNQVADVMRAAQDKVQQFVTIGTGLLQPWFSKVTVGLGAVKDAVAGFQVAPFVAQMMQVIQTAKEFAPITGTVTAAVAAMSAGFLEGVPVLGRFVGAINPVAAALIGFVASTPQVRSAIADFVKSLEPAVPMLQETAAQVAGLAMKVIDDLSPAFAAILDAVSRVILAFAPLAPALADALSSAEPLVNVFARIVEAVAGLPTPVLAAATAMIALNKAFNVKSGIEGAVSGISKVGEVISNVAQAWKAGTETFQDGSKVLAGLKGVAADASSGLGGLAAGFGPVGLAVAGVTAAVGVFSAVQAQAAENSQKLVDATSDVQKTMQGTSTAYTAMTEQTLKQKIAADDAADSLKEVGISNDTMAKAAMGNKDAIASVNKALDEYGKANDTASMSDTAAQKSLAEHQNTVHSVKDALSAYTKVVGDAKAAQEDAASSNKAAAMTAEQLAQGYKDAKSAQDALNQANLSLNEQLDRQGELASDASDTIAKYGKQVADSTNRFDSATEAGRAYNEALGNIASNDTSIIESMKKADVSTGDLRDKMSGLRSDFIATAEQMGASETQANALADAYGLIPDQVTTDADLNIKAALESKDQLVGSINEAEGTVTIDGATGKADTTLGELLGNIDEATGTVQVQGNAYDADMTLAQFVQATNVASGTATIYGDSSNADTTLGALVGNINTANGTVTINGNEYPANSTLMSLLGAVDNSDGTITIKGNGHDAIVTKDSVKYQIDQTTGAVTITGRDNASGVISIIKTNMNNLGDKTVTIRTNWVETHTTVNSTINKGVQMLNAGHSFANGGYVGPNAASHRFAADGLSTRQAGFAKAGSWITWAEDETNGEYYIPVAMSKRRRSMKVLSDAASEFGMALVPKGGRVAANGSAGASLAVSSSGASTVTAEVLRQALSGTRIALDVGGRVFSAYITDQVDSRIARSARYSPTFR